MKALYKSNYFSTHQSDRGRHFMLDLGHKTVRLSFCQLLAFRQKIKNIDLDAHFDGRNHHGMEIVFLCNREHIFVFNTLEVIDLKELIKGTFGVLELNSLVAH